MDNNAVIIKRLAADHDQETFTEFRPLNEAMVKEVDDNVKAIFDSLGGASLIKSSRDVYIKPNGVGEKPYVYTRPEVLEAAIRYWFDAGARNVYLFESCTQAICTRLVFELIGYNELCEKTGATPIYLDEEETVRFEFSGKPVVAERSPQGYELGHFQMPRIIADRLIADKDKNLYVNIPKLKTHCMGVVTLGIKNQWGFPAHASRGIDHNYNLHSKLVDILSHVQPDITLIEGVEGTIYGHYPATALADECVKPFKVLIGGTNVVATDIVGAKIFGLGIEDVPHIALAIERGLGAGIETEDDIRLEGDFDDLQKLDVLNELDQFGGAYPYDLYPQFPDDVRIIKGAERACAEGCVGNSLNNLQIMSLDYHGKGGWTLVLGKGFDEETVGSLSGRVFLAGPCAVEEIGERLIERLGEDNVYQSKECNDLTAIFESICHLMQVNPADTNPHLDLEKIGMIFEEVFKNKCHARIADMSAGVCKLR
jgi:uncharacterized protein (DUF362 family)